jgi:ribosomal protein S7
MWSLELNILEKLYSKIILSFLDYKDRKRENQERVVEETLDTPEKTKQKMTLQVCVLTL